MCVFARGVPWVCIWGLGCKNAPCVNENCWFRDATKPLNFCEWPRAGTLTGRGPVCEQWSNWGSERGCMSQHMCEYLFLWLVNSKYAKMSMWNELLSLCVSLSCSTYLKNSLLFLFLHSPFIWVIDPGAEISKCIRGKLRHSRRCRMVGGRQRLWGNDNQMPTGRNTTGRKRKLMRRTNLLSGVLSIFRLYP